MHHEPINSPRPPTDPRHSTVPLHTAATKAELIHVLGGRDKLLSGPTCTVHVLVDAIEHELMRGTQDARSANRVLVAWQNLVSAVVNPPDPDPCDPERARLEKRRAQLQKLRDPNQL